jgi:hypothetical protein
MQGHRLRETPSRLAGPSLPALLTAGAALGRDPIPDDTALHPLIDVRAGVARPVTAAAHFSCAAVPYCAFFPGRCTRFEEVEDVRAFINPSA